MMITLDIIIKIIIKLHIVKLSREIDAIGV